MADSLAEFRRKNAAQFARAKFGLQALARAYLLEVATDLVLRTPGFGNQYEPPPPAMQYVPTGRLRGGWNYSRVPPGRTSKGWNVARDEDGPFSDYGVETVERIRQQLAADVMGGVSYLVNDVAYGDDIVRGEGNHLHIGPRNFPADTAVTQPLLYRRALANLELSA